VWFDWERGRTGDPKQGLPRNGWFDVSQDPIKLAQLTAAGLMWHRRDVTTAKETLVRTYTPEEIIEAMRLVSWKHRPFFKPGFELTTPLEHATRWRVEDEQAGRAVPSAPQSGSNAEDGALGTARPTTAKYPNPYAAPPPPRIESDTGELRWRHADQKRGVITIATPRSESLIGFVRGSGESTPHLSADVTNEFAVLTLTALDNQPISQSRKLLLVGTTGAARNTGQRFAEDGKTLAEWGTGPVLIEPVGGTINLPGLTDAKSVRATPLTAEGRRLSPSREADRTASNWSITLGEPATTWWLLEVAP
jgi:hypothetical protein